MDIEYFLKERTKFTLYFYGSASKPFLETMDAIENGKPPFDNPPYSEDSEPAFLVEWTEANDGLFSLGLASISMLSSALQLYMSSWVDRIELKSNPLKRKHKKGWLYAYRKITEDFGIDYSQCPIKFDIVEQIVLARNRTQHEEDISNLRISHSKNDLSKYPSPYFVSERDNKHLSRGENNWWFMPQVYIDSGKLKDAVDTIEAFCNWLESEFNRLQGEKYPQ